MNQKWPVEKRDNLYMLSLFALKLWLFRLKYILKLRKHTLKNLDKFFGIVPGVGKWPSPGTDRTGKCKCPAVARGEGEGRAQLELTDALDTMLFYIAMES